MLGDPVSTNSTNISNWGETFIHDGDGAMWLGFVSTCSNDRSTCGSDISTCGNSIVIQTGNVSTYGFYWAYSADRDCSQDFLETPRDAGMGAVTMSPLPQVINPPKFSKLLPFTYIFPHLGDTQ